MIKAGGLQIGTVRRNFRKHRLGQDLLGHILDGPIGFS